MLFAESLQIDWSARGRANPAGSHRSIKKQFAILAMALNVTDIQAVGLL